MTTISFTNDQFDAVCDAQDADANLKDLPAQAVATALAERGHVLFKDYASPSPADDDSGVVELDGPEIPPMLNAGPPQELTTPPGPAPVATRSSDGSERPLPIARTTERSQPVEGMEGVDQRDLAIPTLQLKQAQTRDDDELGISEVPDGNWFLSSDPEDNSHVRTVVFLEVRPGRQFMLPYDDEDRERVLGQLGLDDVTDDVKIVCRSSDRVTPDKVDDAEWEPFATTCDTCPHAKWRTTSKGRRPPACGMVYRTAVVDITDVETPARMWLRSSAIKPTKSLLTNLQLASRRNDLPLCGFSVELSSRKKSGKQGIYHVPRFGRPKQLDDQDVETFRPLREELLASEEA